MLLRSSNLHTITGARSPTPPRPPTTTTRAQTRPAMLRASSHLRWMVLLLLLFARQLHCSPAIDRMEVSEDDFDVLDELLAIDEEEERNAGSPASAEAEAMRKAQSAVLVLNNDNARDAVAGNELVLLLGYAPWCARSALLMPRFAEAAVELRDSGSRIRFAKLDGERYRKAADAVGVKGFPTVLLFVNGTSIPYTGGHTREELATWARKKTGEPVMRLSSADEVPEFKKKYRSFVLGHFDSDNKGIDYDEFVKAAERENETQFIETNDRAVSRVLFPSIGSEDKFIGLVKNEPEMFEKFDGAFEEGEIVKFVQENKFPLITVMTDINSAKVYGSAIKLQVFIFAEEDEFDALRSLVQDVARKFKRKLMFVYVDVSEEDIAKPFLALYGAESDDIVVTAFDTSKGAKHMMENKFNQINLENFCLGLLNGSIPNFFRSEPLPEQKGLVEKVVGRSFESSVLGSPDNVFLEVYAKVCVDCEATSKRVEKLARHFQGVENLRFARIDASANEHPKLNVNNYPTLLFYAAKDKSNPIKVSKKSSVKEIISFISEKMSMSQRVEASSESQEKDEL